MMDGAENWMKRRNNRWAWVIAGLVTILLVATACVILHLTELEEPPAFTPPPFEPTAMVGVPTPPTEGGYTILYREGMSFRVGVCGRVRLGETLQVYLTNPAENTVWLKLRVLDGTGRILGESGLIRPGEHLESVRLSTLPAEESGLVFKIMSYQPETYESMGAVELRPQVVGEE